MFKSDFAWIAPYLASLLFSAATITSRLTTLLAKKIVHRAGALDLATRMKLDEERAKRPLGRATNLMHPLFLNHIGNA